MTQSKPLIEKLGGLYTLQAYLKKMALEHKETAESLEYNSQFYLGLESAYKLIAGWIGEELEIIVEAEKEGGGEC